MELRWLVTYDFKTWLERRVLQYREDEDCLWLDIPIVKEFINENNS